jgi:hypothetical protein
LNHGLLESCTTPKTGRSITTKPKTENNTIIPYRRAAPAPERLGGSQDFWSGSRRR